jgi:hypothetical protein
MLDAVMQWVLIWCVGDVDGVVYHNVYITSFEMEENILPVCVCHSVLLPDSVNNCWVHDTTVHS